MQFSFFRQIVTSAAVLALVVVMLGAYTRLTNAGLGCPDWPGCYGHLVLPKTQSALNQAQAYFPALPIETRKAWTEMVHRYAAGTLATLIFVIAGLALWKGRKKQINAFTNQSLNYLPLFLMVLVVFQAVLGMWTVTLKLLPIVVMAHLIGGIFIFACLCCLRFQLSIQPIHAPRWRWLITIGIILLFCQIALGGWVSANYAGIACVGFPRCNGQWMPSLRLSEGFNVLSPVGQNYQGGVLASEARVTIQFIHRLGALITSSYLIVLAGVLLKNITQQTIRLMALLLITLIGLQCLLGVINVTYMLPLSIAVTHNGVAALLMATLLTLFYLMSGRVKNEC